MVLCVIGDFLFEEDKDYFFVKCDMFIKIVLDFISLEMVYREG